MKAAKILLGALLAIALLLGVAYWSGNQPPRDAVEAARRELGIPIAEESVDVGAVSLHVVSAGPSDGPPVVLLHGFPEFWYAWKDVIPHLARAGYRVIAPDQRGYNESDKPRDVADYRVDLLGDDAAGLIAALGYQRAFVVAHDWGGAVAWNLALRHPERVEKLAILDTPHPDARRRGPPQEETVSWYRTFFQIPWLPELLARSGNWAVQTRMLRGSAAPGAFSDEKLDLYRSAWDRDGAYRSMVNWYRAAFRYPREGSEVRRVRVPTLILVAKHDAFIASDLTRASAELCDDVRLVELGVGTHWVVQEEPERIARELRGFFTAGRGRETIE